MDPFQIRLECVSLLRRLTASQQSIAKVVDYAIRHAPSASDDIWDCIVSECSKTTLNARLNILFLVDALLLQIVDPTGFSASSTSIGSNNSSQGQSSANLAQAATNYLTLATRDLNKFILLGVVPSDNWDAVRLNASSTVKVLASWKRLNIFDHTVIDDLNTQLQEIKKDFGNVSKSVQSDFSKQDVLRRIDEDRERHKRLRERAWILPAKSFIDSMPALSKPSGIAPSATSRVDSAAIKDTKPSDAMEIEFDYLWENLSDLNDDDLEKMKGIDQHWWGSEQSKDDRTSSKRPQEEELEVEKRHKRHKQSLDARI